MNTNSARKVLGVDASADKEEIKKAYRALAMKHHPDREGGNEAKFKEVKEAFEFLEQYGEGGSYTYERTKERPGGGDFKFDPDVLKKFREWAAEAGRKAGMPDGWNDDENHTHDPYAEKQPIASATIDISLKDAYEGITKQVNIPGKGLFTITVPAGVSEDDCIKNIDAGDRFYKVFVRIKTDAKIDWGKTDIHAKGNVTKDIDVPVLRMITGGWMDVETVDGGTVSVRIPAGLEANKLLKIKDRGYWKNSARCVERGNLYLRVIPFIQKLEDMPMFEVAAFISAYNDILDPKVKETPKEE